MTRFIAFLSDLIRKPSSFRADPWGHARNQFLHGYAIGLLGTWLTGWLLGIPGWAFVIPFYLLIEAYQITARDGEISDSVEDFANVLVMIFAATALHPGFFIIHALYLIAGLLWRMEDRDRQEVQP